MRLKAVSGIVLTVLLVGMLTLAFNIQPVKAGGTIYIYYDGSIEGTTHISTADNITYTFTSNIYDEIIVERSNIVIDGAGYTLQGTGSGTGIFVGMMTGNVTVKNMKIRLFTYGIALGIGMPEFPSGYNRICGNVITFCYICIRTQYSFYDTISGNILASMDTGGIALLRSPNTTIFRNNITSNSYGIRIWDVSNCTISENNITNNEDGIDLLVSSNNSIYHNNFINNTVHAFQASAGEWINSWDDGYPSGGNYWSDYNGTDLYSGPNQDESGSDGIGDAAYVIDANNTDRYPLMYPWGSPPPPTCTLTICSQPIGVTFTVDGVPHTTPWSGNYSKGASVGLVMPETHSGYMWYYWLEDIDTNRIKTVTVDTNITLTGAFRPPVGGIWVPVDKLGLLAPYIALASTILVATAATAIYVKRRKKKQ